MDKSTNAVAYAPGYYIRDILTTLNISYNDFAYKKYNWNVQKADNRLFKTYLNEPKIKP